MTARFPAIFRYVIWALPFLLPGCHRSVRHADIPDSQDLISSLHYLDSAIRSVQIDSIGSVNDRITATVAVYADHIASPDDKAALDSLTRINVVVNDLMQFCNSTLINIDLLKQNIINLDNQYRSGKIKINQYVSALLEAEQIIVEIDNQFTDKRQKALLYLSNQSDLIARLSPLTIPGTEEL